ncbi:MAG TPA: hypothetical protein VF807_04675 [Ktedonobacterales bacterium]
MRVDRILNEGEAVNILRRMGFSVRESVSRQGWYEVEHPQLGGGRTFTEDQLCRYAEGLAAAESLFRKPATRG